MIDKALLQNVYLFKTMTSEQLSKIAALAHVETFAAEDDVFSQGDKAFALYLIKQGSVRIHQRTKTGEKVEVLTLGAGTHFGEMAYVDSEPRSASATTDKEAEIVIIPYEKLNLLLKSDPTLAVQFYRELAHFLCGRLRVTTNDLSFSKEKNVSHF